MKNRFLEQGISLKNYWRNGGTTFLTLPINKIENINHIKTIIVSPIDILYYWIFVIWCFSTLNSILRGYR